MFLCRFSARINMFTGNVAAPVFERVPSYPSNGDSCDFQHFLTPGLVFGANGTIVVCYKHSNELHIMDTIFHIYFRFTVSFCLFVLRCLMLVRIPPPPNKLCDTV